MEPPETSVRIRVVDLAEALATRLRARRTELGLTFARSRSKPACRCPTSPTSSSSAATRRSRSSRRSHAPCDSGLWNFSGPTARARSASHRHRSHWSTSRGTERSARPPSGSRAGERVPEKEMSATAARRVRVRGTIRSSDPHRRRLPAHPRRLHAHPHGIPDPALSARAQFTAHAGEPGRGSAASADRP